MYDHVIARRRVLLAGAAASVALAAPALAQPAWPNRPIRMMVGFAPGGPTDVLSRMLAPGMAEILGVPVVVDNRPGANGNLAMDFVARSTDSHTLTLVNVGQVAINPHTYTTMPVDPLKDLVPVATAITGDLLLVAHPKLGVTTLTELIALLKANPGKFSYASTGSGGITHVVMELFKNATGIEIEAVHYRGAGPASQDMLAGTTHLIIDALSMYEQTVRDGRLKGIAVLSAQRSPILPDVPTMVESGFGDFVYPNWFGLLVPRGTPPAVIERLADANRRAQQSPQLRERLQDIGWVAAADTPEHFTSRIMHDYRVYREIVRAKNIRAD
ncbi:tripartite tricarboxylate transporter substrate binding protein [Roseicella sp. DB1501]|uniref:Bug family tripartite tricarboxylate transporter substrate binding protein n=1 Tax=Roseicella sp. DB1501 TaxID=2730925 RepID=UPI00149271E7|nr:tripartite tricarboxylate transporter substrate binding protein [Roseicella sp. DB1501]NOG74009.1 tripartite tricarboxylate transporter substrate binding protein [Roseicella sp. DB1501]